MIMCSLFATFNLLWYGPVVVGGAVPAAAAVSVEGVHLSPHLAGHRDLKAAKSEVGFMKWGRS